jgi:hypothetical protein
MVQQLLQASVTPSPGFLPAAAAAEYESLWVLTVRDKHLYG